MKQILLLATLALGAVAQPAFEVASIKPLPPDAPTSATVDPGGLSFRQSLRWSIMWAWDVPNLQYYSGPDWLEDQRFDITARTAGATATDDMRLMLRTLLSRRLGVRVREEMRVVPVYFLVPVKGGPRFHDATVKDPTRFRESQGEGESRFGGDRAIMTADHVSIVDFAKMLSDFLQRPVVDHTGLTGHYDIRLDPTAFIDGANPQAPGQGPIDTVGLILSAVPAQLGLKVEPGKDSVKFFVVEAANKTVSDE